MKIAWWKIMVVVGVLIWAVFNVWPREGRSFFNQKLGLDLKGGSYLAMQVVTDDAIKAEADIEATRIGERLRREGFPDARVTVGETLGEVVVSGVAAARLSDASRLAQEEAKNWALSNDGTSLRLQMPSAEMTYVRDNAVKQALTTIRNRVDAFGVGEVNIQRLGGAQSERVLVELPGVEDPSRVKTLMQTQARLELRLAHYRPDGSGPFLAPTREELNAVFGGAVPPGVELLPVEETDKQTLQKIPAGFLAVEKASVITGSDLRHAQPSQDEFGQPVVSFTLRVESAERFSRFTRANVGRSMPVVLDDKVITYPRINSEIGMNGQISGGFTPQAAENLAIQLRSGALPARVVTVEERTVGPSLGADSISAGLRASLIGAAFTCLFMLIYYKLSGVNAVIALALNMLMLFAGMAQVGAALTLPGIAGLALTVGMAVDSNVLIFERMREELRAGRTIPATVAFGFNKAMSAIIDSHVTTVVSALFLFNYGTGPVRGFAVTLVIGLIANLFTAVFFSRTIFETILATREVKTLSV